MSILDDVSLVSKIGLFVLLFIICVATFTAFIEELGLLEEDLDIPSHESEYNNLNFILGFAILLSIGGMVLILFRSRSKERTADELEAYDRAVLRRYYKER